VLGAGEVGVRLVKRSAPLRAAYPLVLTTGEYDIVSSVNFTLNVNFSVLLFIK